MEMKLFILLIIASIGCSTATDTTTQVEELKTLKTKYATLITEIDVNGKSLDRSILNEKQNKARVLETTINDFEQQIDAIVIDLTYDTDYVKSSEIPFFKIQKIIQLDKNLAVSLQYSGCGIPHQFELITNGNIDVNGIIDFQLVDKTTGDYCKMMLIRTKYFDISKINKKSSVTGFRLNNGEMKSFSRSK